MNMWAKIAGFALMAGLASPATAVVTYSFTNTLNESFFSWTSSDYITSFTEVDAADLNTCSPGVFSGECEEVRFVPNFSNNQQSPVTYSLVTFRIGIQGSFFYFPQIAFTTPGVYSDLTNGQTAFLSVFPSRDHGTAPAVPEPDTWVMLIAGFGLIGAARRRMRAAAA